MPEQEFSYCDPAPPAVLSQAARMLAEARSLDDVKAIRDRAEAARAYAKAADLGDDAVGYASAIKLNAERKAGQLLAEMREAGERARPGDATSQAVTSPSLLGHPTEGLPAAGLHS